MNNISGANAIVAVVNADASSSITIVSTNIDTTALSLAATSIVQQQLQATALTAIDAAISTVNGVRFNTGRGC